MSVVETIIELSDDADKNASIIEILEQQVVAWAAGGATPTILTKHHTDFTDNPHHLGLNEVSIVASHVPRPVVEAEPAALPVTGISAAELTDRHTNPDVAHLTIDEISRIHTRYVARHVGATGTRAMLSQVA